MKTQEKNSASSSILEDELTKLKVRIDALKDEISNREQRRSQLNARILEIYTQPLSGSEVVEFVSEIIDYRAKNYERKLKGFDVVGNIRLNAPRIGHYGGRELTLEDVDTALGIELAIGKQSVSTAPIHSEAVWNLEVLPQFGEFMHWQFFFFGDLMKEKLKSVFDDCGYTAKDGEGVTLNDRRAEIAALQSEIKELSNEIHSANSEIAKLSSPLKTFSGNI